MSKTGLALESVMTLIIVMILIVLTNFLNMPFNPYKLILYSVSAILLVLWLVRIITSND